MHPVITLTRLYLFKVSWPSHGSSKGCAKRRGRGLKMRRVRTAEIGTRVKKTLPRIRAVRIDDREAFGIPAPRPRLLYRRIAGKLTKRLCAGFKLLMPTESS